MDEPIMQYLDLVRRFVYGLAPWEISASAVNPDDPASRNRDPRAAHTWGAMFNKLDADDAWRAIDKKGLSADEWAYLNGVDCLFASLTVDSGVVFGVVTNGPEPVAKDHPAVEKLKRYLDHPFARDVESAWMAKELRRGRRQNPALLVDFMAGKDEADVQDVADRIGTEMKDGAVRKLVTDTNKHLIKMGASFRFATRPGKIIRNSVAR